MSRASGVALLALWGCGGGRTSEPPPAESTGQASPASPVKAGTTLRGHAPRAFGGFPSVIELRPVDPADHLDAPSESEAVVMDQFGRSFEPGLILARTGQPVEFSNSEDELHNVHVIDSRSGTTLFNVATLPFDSYVYRFEEEGVYEVSCNTHAGMFAYVIVSAAPHFAAADKDGAFTLTGIAPGSYRLRVWNADESRRGEQLVQIAEGRAELELELELEQQETGGSDPQKP